MSNKKQEMEYLIWEASLFIRRKDLQEELKPLINRFEEIIKEIKAIENELG